MALSNAYEDNTSQMAKSPEPRVLGAKKMLEKLRRNNSTTLIVSQMTEMCQGKFFFFYSIYSSFIIHQTCIVKKMYSLRDGVVFIRKDFW